MYKIFKISKILIFIVFFVCGFISKVSSDIIYLKNGRSIKGLIKSEDEKKVELDLGFGTVQLTQDEIERIERSSPEEASLMRQEWERRKKLEAEAIQKKEPEAKEIKFSKTTEGIIVNTLLNKKVKASLILDTGAFVVLLSQRIGKELGIESSGVKGIIKKVVLADGSETEARLVVLDSVDVEGVEAKNIEAAILLNESMKQDGLLGRSFLNKFNFQIDPVNKKLILKRLKTQNILEKTRYFSVTYPSDWEKSLDKERLIIFGPVLPEEESEFYRPYIIIEKDTHENALSYAKVVKEWYGRFKDSPDTKNKISGWLEESFKKSNPEVQFISSNFKEKKDIIILDILYFSKEYNSKIYNVKIITKDEPVKSYNLEFFCIDKYFNEFLPVFNKCLESFTINE